MSFYKFGKNDLYTNVITTYPEVNFFIYGTKRYLANQDRSKINSNSPSGHVNLYELNVNRASDNLIYPFMPKDSTLTTFKKITTDSFASQDYGAIVSGSFPLTASITTILYTASVAPSTVMSRKYVEACVNILNNNAVLSPHYQYSSSLGDKSLQEVTLIDIPTIIRGDAIKKGSISLEFFVSGSSLGKLVDKNQNGELIQIDGYLTSSNEKVAGVALYEEGIILLTGSWDLSTTHTERYRGDTLAPTTPKWNAFGRLTELTPSSSYQIKFSGSQQTSVLTMMARAPASELNLSHNPTFVEYDTAASGNVISLVTSSTGFYETSERTIKNTVSSSFACHSESFKRQTFITKVGIYDKEKNLIAIANMSRAVKKTEERDLTFKLKLDI